VSHIVEVKTAFKSMDAVKKAADQLKGREVSAEFAEPGKTIKRKLYQGDVSGVAAIQLKGWRYPVMVQDDGSCKMDNYNGSWGRQEELDAFSQEYGKQVATAHLRKQGYRMQTEKVEQDGTVELVFVG